MAQIQTLRRRIKATKTTQQTTKAMQLVDATKLRRAQQASGESKAYMDVAATVLGRLNRASVNFAEVKLTHRRPVKRVTILAIAADRGLAGAYNHQIARKLKAETLRYQADGVHVQIMAVGAQLIRAVEHFENVEILAKLTGPEAEARVVNMHRIASQLITAYEGEATDAIRVIYTQSKSALSQQVVVAPMWPLEPEELAGTSATPSLPQVEIFEPSPEEVLRTALERLMTARVLNAFQEARVSEHAMRMIAMRNATDNAGELIDRLTLEVNTVRQAAITQELSEITGAVAAMEE